MKLQRNPCAELRFFTIPRPYGGGFTPLRDDKWHQVFQGRLAKAEVERRLYERGKDEDCLIAVRLTNLANRAVGVDLRKFWNVIYPNSWGFSKTPALGVVDEERIIREPMSAADKKKLMLDYSENRLTTLLPKRPVTYFRKFTVGYNIRKQIDSDSDAYLIVGLDGALQLTDGQTTEEIMFQQNDGVADARRWVAIRLPVHWRTVSQNSFVVEERP